MSQLRTIALALSLLMTMAAPAPAQSGNGAKPQSPTPTTKEGGGQKTESNADCASKPLSKDPPKPATTQGQEEDAIFGGSTGAPPGAAQTPGCQTAQPPKQPTPGKNPNQSEEDAVFGEGSNPGGQQTPKEGGPATANGNSPVNPTATKGGALTIGGTLFMSAQGLAYSNQSYWDWTMPDLLDIYLDARPSPRIRFLAAGQISFDPTGSADLTEADLDQAWVNFDIKRKAFVTAGKQHVKWGTGHFWNPTDFLQPARFNPLSILDSRLGVPLIKLQIPWEKRGWNFYGYTIFQDQTGQFLDTPVRVGGAGRAEIVLGPAEVGVEAVVQQDRNARFGIDVSSGAGPFDLYAEAAFQQGGTPRVVLGNGGNEGPAPGTSGTASYQSVDGVQSQVSAGGNWQVNINDRDSLTVGVEGFYNGSGYTDRNLYPALIQSQNLIPFYLGKYYGALYTTFSLPRGQTQHTVSFTTFSNASDASFLSRLDYTLKLRSHVTFDAYGDAHYGTPNGEFRSAFNSQGVSRGTPIVDLGTALKITF